MKKYRVAYETLLSYEIEVEAESKDAAAAIIYNSMGEHETMDIDSNIVQIWEVTDSE